MATDLQKKKWVNEIKAWGGFQAREYKALYPDIPKLPFAAFYHYTTYGIYENRRPNKDVLIECYISNRRQEHLPRIPPIISMIRENAPELIGEMPFAYPKPQNIIDIVTDWGGFDPVYYLEVNPDVAAAGIPPLQHYCQSGIYENRDPNRQFNVRKYVANNDTKNFSKVPAFLWMIKS